ncbi:MAG: DUF1080 domain-containing protein [Akkermansiaceae bacterium]|nr:DUF1080 domain-containing protein [Akkermansiaceae bacterium]NNM28284.1 DUF1080 domain-containing protein [Akkermansiaceae bacterium]
MKPILIMAALLPLYAGAEPSRWQPLFNGKDLAGWSPAPGGKWEVIDGTITGTSGKDETRHGLLFSDRTFSDFVVRAQFKVTTGDSGFYFRVRKTASKVGVQGFQAEVDNTPEVGGLYETARRAWVRKPDPALIKRVFKPGDWNLLTVTAIGDDITVSINGVTVTELLGDAACLKEGHFALQLHGGQDMHVQFREIAVLEM